MLAVWAWLAGCVKVDGAAVTQGGAGGPGARLILVGDTGMQNAMIGLVSGAVRREAEAGARVVALGDLYYPHPPGGEGCAEAVAARYREFYGGLPAGSVYAVAGNHDVYSEQNPAGPDAISPESVACTTAAFRRMGWLGEGEALASRVARVDVGGVTVDLGLVEAGLFSEERPGLAGGRAEADWKIIATHYVLSATFGKGVDEIGAFYGVSREEPFDLWVNGHAHQIEARMTDHLGRPVLAVTSGGGGELRPVRGFQAELWRAAPSFFAYGRCPEDPAACAAEQAAGRLPPELLPKAGEAGGYVRLDLLDRRHARVQPVICAAGACTERPAVRCERAEGGRGVNCAPEPTPEAQPVVQ